MTQEQKDLLLKDLCARFPYNVAIDCRDEDSRFTCYLTTDMLREIQNNNCYLEYKPYLFPLSSMTEEQRQEFLSVAGYERREEDCGRHTETYYYDMVGHEHNFYPNSDAIDWLNKNHFDYRGLIPMGLAEYATGLNIY